MSFLNVRNERANIPRIVSDTVNEGVGGAGGFGEEVVSIKDEGFSPSRSLSTIFSFSALSFSSLPLPTSSPTKTVGFFFFPLFPLLAFRLPGMAAAPAPVSVSASASLSSLSSVIPAAEGRGIGELGFEVTGREIENWRLRLGVDGLDGGIGIGVFVISFVG